MLFIITTSVTYAWFNLTVSGTCNSINEQIVPLSEGALSSVITENISIGLGITHEYTLTLLFKEINKEQNYNQGKI